MTVRQCTDELDSGDIQKAMQLSAKEAERQQAAVAIAIVNASGVLAGFLRMPGSFLATVDYAQWKAWTATSFDMPSENFGQLVESFEPLIRDGLLAHSNATPLPGGFPIHKDNRLIGAIGVSGGSGEQDNAIARAGLGAFSE